MKDPSSFNPCAVAHDRLRSHPVLFASIAVIHTLLTAGIVFGWASLLPLLRSEGIELSAADFTRIFTHGAVGNYLSSLPFGVVLDRYGPKKLGILASLMFAVGVWLISCAHISITCLDLGFTLLGFAGPAIQLPGLHLARLFPGDAVEGGSGGAALFMSAQAGAFDGGTIVFCLFSILHSFFQGIHLKTMFRVYMAVPAFTLGTAIFYWPKTILQDSTELSSETLVDLQPDTPASKKMSRKRTSSYTSVGSPYVSPSTILLQAKQQKEGSAVQKSPLRDQQLSVILKKPPFYCLATWVAIHILKLNFVVATINDQLDQQMQADKLPEGQSDALIGIFGAMLPFGFVVLPIVAYLLNKSVMLCFQVATTVGCIYGAVLAFCPNQAWYLVGLVFPAVATSRQLVYSTVFHQTGELFGFENYGVLLGLTNVVVSAVSMCQGPLVEWAQLSPYGYLGPNLVLLILTLPLYAIVYGTRSPSSNKSCADSSATPNESTKLLSSKEISRQRALSERGL